MPDSVISLLACQSMAATGSLAEGTAAHSPSASALEKEDLPPGLLLREQSGAFVPFLFKPLILLYPVFPVADLSTLIRPHDGQLVLIYLYVFRPQDITVTERHINLARIAVERLAMYLKDRIGRVDRRDMSADQVSLGSV